MENLVLTRWEKRLLYALKRYWHADIGMHELHGYFKFPPWEVTLSAIEGLKQKGFIRDKQAPFHGLELTDSGKQYLLQNRFSLFLWCHIGKIVIAALGGVAAAAISHWIGLT